jgi:carboxymethylenebutenolidase
MRRTRGSTITPLLSGIAFVAAIAGGFIAGGHQPASRAAGTSLHNEWVTIPNARGKMVRAYVVYPDRKDAAPSVIVIHEIFGMNAGIELIADRYAARGYVAIAPDLLSSEYKSTDSVGNRATQLISALPDSILVPDLDAVYHYVNGLTSVQKDNTGLIGFCWGGGAVYRYAATNPKIKAAVPCYGPVSDTAMLKRVKAPVFAVYGETDNRVTSMEPGIKAAMDAAHNSFTFEIYKGVGHGFLREGANSTTGPEVDRARADIAAFFARKLDRK